MQRKQRLKNSSNTTQLIDDNYTVLRTVTLRLKKKRHRRLQTQLI